MCVCVCVCVCEETSVFLIGCSCRLGPPKKNQSKDLMGVATE